MNNPKHTPGPWNVEQSSNDLDGNTFVMINSKQNEIEANAKLIAAAPELLKLLELAVRELEWADKNCQIKPLAGVSTFKSAVIQIKAAIAKATGES